MDNFLTDFAFLPLNRYQDIYHAVITLHFKPLINKDNIQIHGGRVACEGKPAAIYSVIGLLDFRNWPLMFEDRIYGSWFPLTGNTPTMDLDIIVVDHRFKMQSNNSVIDILIPIQG